MKATISTDTVTYDETLEDGGFLRKAKTRQRTSYSVTIFVDFSEEERAVLTRHKLWDSVIWTDRVVPSEYYNNLLKKQGLPPDHEPTTLIKTIKELAAPKTPEKSFPGTSRSFDSATEALNFRTEMKTKHLPDIKRLMESSQASFGKSETLEF